MLSHHIVLYWSVSRCISHNFYTIWCFTYCCLNILCCINIPCLVTIIFFVVLSWIWHWLSLIRPQPQLLVLRPGGVWDRPDHSRISRPPLWTIFMIRYQGAGLRFSLGLGIRSRISCRDESSTSFGVKDQRSRFEIGISRSRSWFGTLTHPKSNSIPNLDVDPRTWPWLWSWSNPNLGHGLGPWSRFYNPIPNPKPVSGHHSRCWCLQFHYKIYLLFLKFLRCLPVPSSIFINSSLIKV